VLYTIRMIIIGHRGARGLAPENTIAGLRKALEHHVGEIEFDVRVTKDNKVVLLHDAETSDVSGTKMSVKDTPYKLLKKHKPDLTTLAEAFDFVGNRVHLLIEVKPDEPVAPIAKVIIEYLENDRFSTTDISLGSFSQKTLRELHDALPDVEKVVIERWSGVIAHFRARQVDTKRLNMKHLWLWSGFLKSMHRRGYQIAPYTLNDPIKARKWQPYLTVLLPTFPTVSRSSAILEAYAGVF
jgi:glycerophosphoryl diester phosphodiesterase